MLGPLKLFAGLVAIELQSAARRGVASLLRRLVLPAEPEAQPLSHRDVEGIQAQIRRSTGHGVTRPPR